VTDKLLFLRWAVISDDITNLVRTLITLQDQ
jgi:hypothetical protein